MKSNATILDVKNVTKIFESGLIRTSKNTAVDEVSFDIKKGEIKSLVGESGSGKTTIAKIILRLIPYTEGSISLHGSKINFYSKLSYYRHVQAIFQDPYSSYNYFYTIDHVLNAVFKLREEPLSKKEKTDRIHETLKLIGLNPNEVLGRYPHQLSGGQLQRFMLARILLIEPDLLVADEPTSMIDASSRAGILNLLKRIRDERGLSILFITHDIGQAQYIADNVCIMKEGKIVEQGSSKDVFTNPVHPYSKNLLDCCPSIFRKWDLEVESNEKNLVVHHE